VTVVLRVGAGVEGLGTVSPELRDWEVVSRAVGGEAGQARAIVVRRAGQLARGLATERGEDVHVVDGSSVRVVHPPEPTPWGTGSVLAAASAVVVLVALLALTRGVAALSGVLALAANIVVVGGLAPSAWLARDRSVWRWVALGAAAGTLGAWFWLLLTALT
jgi:hypothetical protein